MKSISKTLFLLVVVLMGSVVSRSASAQSTFTLEQCIEACQKNYPLVNKTALLEKSAEYTVQNAAKGYLPQFSLTAQASYQTQVTSLGISIPNVSMPTLSKDHYGVTAQVDQTIWDGGRISAAQTRARAELAANAAQVEVDIYALRARVINLYFATLLLDQQIAVNQLLSTQLSHDLERIVAANKNGTASGADVDAVRVQQISTMQNTHELQTMRATYLNMLGILCGLPLHDTDVLSMPDPTQGENQHGERPEYNLFRAQMDANRAQRASIKAGLMPTVGVYVQGGYGRPSLNMLSDSFKPYAVGGIRLLWNFGALYTRKNDLKKIKLNDELVDVTRETFSRNLAIDTAQYHGDFIRYQKLADADDNIIQLRENISKSARAQLENGTIDATQYMDRLTNEYTARQEKTVHVVQALNSIYQEKNSLNQ